MNALKLRLLIFDWDGTLADSVSTIVHCKQYLAKKYNLPVPTVNLVKEVLGTQFSAALAKCFPTANNKLLAQIGEEFQTLMQKDENQSNLFTNATTVLNFLKQQNIKITIATSKSRCELEKALAHTKLTDFFDHTCCGEEYSAKPDPAMLAYLMNRYNFRPDECLMVGDTTTDIQFAANANVPTVCVTFGAHSKANLDSKAPLALIDEWMQLLDVINKLYR
jgi:phosphoglycolate phosphatase